MSDGVAMDLLPGYACRRFGAPGDPPGTLLLHGFTGTGADWDFWPATAPAALAPDLPGHGDSPDPRGDFAAETERLLAVLPAGVERLVGYSLGGRIALCLLAAAPQRFTAATIVSAHPGLFNAGQRDGRRAVDQRWIALLRTAGIAAFVDAWERQALFASQDRLPADVLAAQRRRRLAQRAEGLAASLACCGLAEMPDTWAALRRWPGRLSWLAGARDDKFVAIAERVARERPGTQVHIVPDAGHNLLLEAPAAVLAAAAGAEDHPAAG
ncbi:alpha/beta fold hydrolase [uncultured Thiohalocapsa sp.]|uniref:alpha/beta fold hydrolase n=1 Tax=uncultured Thiohalocapsa sp. TaxID=768990 RepID=UPI0025EFD74D|nr:alpha/beta fold hydrolase [uncultured Thiohalocapsa sp.]